MTARTSLTPADSAESATNRRSPAPGLRSPAPGDGVPGQRREVQGDEQKAQRGEGTGVDERPVRLADQFEDERDGEDDRRDDREHGCLPGGEGVSAGGIPVSI